MTIVKDTTPRRVYTSHYQKNQDLTRKYGSSFGAVAQKQPVTKSINQKPVKPMEAGKAARLADFMAKLEAQRAAA